VPACCASRRPKARGPLAALALRAAVLVAAAGTAITPQALAAQPVAGQADEYNGRPIRGIEIRERLRDGSLRPLDQTTETLALNQLRSIVGEPFRAESVASDLRNLNRTGRFGELSTELIRTEGGGVIIRYLVTLQPIVIDVQAVGNRSVGDADIAEVVALPADTPVDRFELDRAARRIEALYEERGFFRAQVTWDEQELADSGVVLFRIEEGQRIRVTDIRFEGAGSFTPGVLKNEIRTAEAGILERGRLEPEVLGDDRSTLIEFYRDRGYLDVRVAHTITESPNGREAIVTFVVDEGPVYTLRDVTVTYFDVEQSEGVLSAAQAAGLMEIRTGDVYSINKLESSIVSVEAALHKMGYADARVREIERRDQDEPLVDLELVVRQGERFLTGEVLIRGNDITRQNVVRRQVKVRPDRPLDLTQVERSENLLRQTRLFDLTRDPPRITVQEPDPIEPRHRDVLVQVRETRTGSFRFGAQVDSDSGLVGTISLTERNFDITDTPDSAGEFFSGRAFRGAGQTFSINLLPGNEIQTYSIGLSDPNVFDSPYSAGGNLFFRRRIFDEHDRDTLGTSLSAGRTFGELWTGTLGYRFERTRLFNIEDDAATDFFDFADESNLDGIGLTLTRSTLNNNFRPTGGSRTRLRAEQVGLLGTDFDFTKLSLENVGYLTVREDFLGRRTILKATTELNYIPQDVADVPIYERFTRGGRNFRGFEFRTISPRGVRNDNGQPSDDPVGGTFDLFFGLELQQPLFGEVLSGVVFLDTGTVVNDPGFEDYRVSAGLGLRISIPQLSPVPIAFDFGFPIVSQTADENRLFTFSVDLPF